MDLPRTGLWTSGFDMLDANQSAKTIAELEELGYGALWIPETMGRDGLTHAALLLARSESIIVATGVTSIWARDPMAMRAGQLALAEAYPDRFLLGLGVSHAPMVEGMRGHTYGKPVTAMRAYLETMETALYLGAAPTATPHTVIGALGPNMLTLAAERTQGAHPYNVTPEHTAQAREILGAGKLLAPELAVTLTADPSAARVLGRAHLAVYLGLPNYVNNLRRLGFGDADFAEGGSDRLVDGIVAWGTADQVAARVREHHDAGADHVCLQVLVERGAAAPVQQWRELAAVLVP